MPPLVAARRRRRRHVHLQTTALPAGNTRSKVPSTKWDENYARAARRTGEHLFQRPREQRDGHFQLQTPRRRLTIETVNTAAPSGNVEWEGLRHDPSTVTTAVPSARCRRNTV